MAGGRGQARPDAARAQRDFGNGALVDRHSYVAAVGALAARILPAAPQDAAVAERLGHLEVAVGVGQGDRADRLEWSPGAGLELQLNVLRLAGLLRADVGGPGPSPHDQRTARG